ncbi:NACHT domain-containing protein [Marinilabilia salmonicolor]|uniref:NACHT domain-containing protein n=1 Tax=Marinilabilia salmonicolor TaxID=989 RepID=UPI00046B02E0|nr:ATP-binding protein [Marinilabilia salmonicolor]
MHTYNIQIPPPANWQDFERFCHSLWMDILDDPNIQMNGRLGQEQSGVDIYGYSKNNLFYCIQCKGKNTNYGGKVTEKELKEEIKKVKSFYPLPDIFILATTAQSDQNIQAVARKIDAIHKKKNLFRVYIFSWDEICQRLESSPNTLKKFYPELVNNNELQDFKKWISNQLPQNQANGGKDNSNNQASLEEIKKAFKVQSSFLSKWPQTLTINKKWLERKEENEWLSKTHSASYSTTILLGEQGTGKSALLARMTNKLHSQGIPVLGIKADKLSHSVTDLQSLSAFLRLPGNITSCIKKIARNEPVFLLIDQMDALSDLVDVKTNRLSVLLDLINNLHHLSNIHILASSRPFELKYDSRFNTIEADTIELFLLSWDAVKETLDELNIKFTFIDNDFKNFIRRPNNLNLFLSHIKNYPEQKFKSHIDLYEQIWNYSLGSGSERKARSELLIKLATEMTEEAKLALPAINFEDYLNEIDFLCQTGLLVKNNKQISFAHQTLQAFVWTRSLLKNGSLVKFVLTHQNNLNIRPKLFTAILYLRVADPWEYNNQLNLLLNENRTHLRTHILFLLIESIGSFIDPSDHEFCVFSDLLRDRELTSKICLSIAGSKGWFNKFKETHITYLMNGSVSQQKAASIILASAIRFSPEIVLDFLIKYWKNEEQLYYLFHVLQNNTYWNEKAIDLAEYIITSKNIGNIPAQELTQRISKTNPESAVNLAAQFFIKKLEFLELSPISEEIENPEDNVIDEWLLEQKRRKPFEDFAEVNTTWQHLNILAKLTPKIFVSAFWPLLNKLSYHLKVQYSESRFEYRNVSGTWFYLNGDSGHMRNYLVSSMETGIKLFAKQYQDDFLSFLNKAKKSSFHPSTSFAYNSFK